MNYFRCVAFACYVEKDISFIRGFLTEDVVHFGNFLLISIRKIQKFIFLSN